MKKLLLVSVLVLSFGFTQELRSQFLDNFKKKTEEKIKKEGEKKVDEKINKGVEKVYNEAEKQLNVSGDNKKVDSTKSKNSQQNLPPALETDTNIKAVINSKYDFIPGEKVIFFDDFTSENIGDFPIQWNTTGSGEVVTTNIAEGRWFYITNGRGATTLDEPLSLPENYTIEFDVIPTKDQKNNNNSAFSFSIISTTKPKDLVYGLARPGDAGIRFSFGYSNYYSTYFNDHSPEVKGTENEPKLLPDKKYRISVCVQKTRIKLYIGEHKLFDLPKAMSQNYKYNMVRFDRGTTMFSNFRIATGLPDMRSKLITEGKLISYGIYFDVNKDVVKPESYPSIKEIAAILRDNPDIKIKIIGHTDSDGDDKLNLDLSKRRASSVKNTLVKDFGIEEARIETDGKGESQPIVQNNSAVNKALNRRVEFIKT